jgi:hypothetical protein
MRTKAALTVHKRLHNEEGHPCFAELVGRPIETTRAFAVNAVRR